MRIFVVLICSLALASLALGQEEGKEKKKEQKKPAQAGQVSPPPGKATGKPTEVGKPAGAGKPTGTGQPAEVGKAKGTGKPTEVGKAKETGQPAEVGKAKGTGKPTEVGKAKETGQPTEVGKAKGTGKPTEVGKATGAGTPVTAVGTAGAKVKPQHFDLPNKPKPEVAPAVTFQQNRRIEGAQNWQGSQYTAFRNYTSEWHDQGWWTQRYNRIVVIGGGAYYWNAGYWYPAWGYDQANSYYPYDGPIYSSTNNLPPDQVIANVQSALQQQGYYQGEVDGLLGPQTRAAITDYQRANGLAETAAIDQPTLESLGMS